MKSSSNTALQGTLSVSCWELAQLAEAHPYIWQRMLGASVGHVMFGSGQILNIQPRYGYIPLITVNFPSLPSTALFNTDAFKSSKFTEIQIPNDLLGLLADFRLEFAALQLAAEIKIATLQLAAEIQKTQTKSLVRLARMPSPRDVKLCLAWAGVYSDALTHPNGTALSAQLEHYEASRLLSARFAELAAADYYVALGHKVTDISITQIEEGTDQWKDFDLLVDGRPVDVKNARRSFSSPESYVEHCVPRFKQARGIDAEVSIVGVLSDYHTAEKIMGDETAYQILGEVRVSDIRQLYVWMRKRFSHLLNLDGLWKAGYQPGWVFEYPKEHYPGRTTATVVMAREIISQFIRANISADSIPGWLLTLCQDRELVGQLKISAEKHRILCDLHSLSEQLGFTRPALFVYVMGFLLESIANEVQANLVEGVLRDLIFVEGSPLGLEDTQGYIAELVDVLLRVQNESIRQKIKFVAFKLTHPSILRGQRCDGSWMTLLAYCGGWRVFPVKVKCGAAPLFFGQNEVCPSCGHLVCDECGYCSQNCDLVVKRQEAVARMAQSR